VITSTQRSGRPVGLAKFSTNGLREYEALAVDARRTLAELGRAIRNFDQNPQRVLFSARARPT
jgi:phospholipid/cholesterol/gamma-HCH transport system substrate-binding protein